MTGKAGVPLGADLGELRFAGKRTLPAAAEDYWSAYTSVPGMCSQLCTRGGGLGADPGGEIDAYLSRVNKMLLDTRTSLALVGEALVWVADEYASADSSCQQEFQRKQNALDKANGY